MVEDTAEAKPKEGKDRAEAKEAVDWRRLITDAAANRPEPLTAETYLGKWAASPVKLRCSNGGNYAVKGPEQRRVAFNDQVAARLGRVMGAPVPEHAALVHVPQELIKVNRPQMDHMKAGVCHATKVAEDTTDRLGVQHTDEAENRGRFAKLAVFFGWMGGSDQQYIYNKAAPHLVHSVDHGHFFHGGPNWTIDSLRTAPPAAAHAELVQQCKLTSGELATASAPLRDITPKQIADAVAVPPDEWGVTLDERIALAEYLHKRQAQMVAAYEAAESDEKGKTQ